jgi:glycerol kinase
LRANWSVEATWEPGMEEGRRQALYREWKKAVTRAFGWVEG